MNISIIAAMGSNRVIGYENRLPWELPEDLQHFKALTLHKPIIMGRKTYDSIGKPLPKRQNIILTRDNAFQANGCDIVHSIDEAVEIAEDKSEIMIIGGAHLYEQCLPLANVLYLTLVHQDYTGDTYFPPFDLSACR